MKQHLLTKHHEASIPITGIYALKSITMPVDIVTAQARAKVNTNGNTIIFFKYWLVIVICTSAILHANAQDIDGILYSKPFSYSGSISLTGIGYTASGIPNRRQSQSYLITGNPTFNFYGINVPLYFSISEADRSFRQPFNQFGISPTYKWVTLHAGYSNVDFSPYTLGGHTMLGAGFELTPGKLRVGFMYGRLNRATTIDTTTQALVPYSFSRKAYAAKIGYGTDKNFFEFSYLSAKDDSTTAPGQIPQQLDVVKPAKNNVLGYSTRFTFLRYFSFESDGAVSLYTTNINSSLKLDSISNPFLKKVSHWFDANATSEYYTAFSGAIGYRVKNYGLKVNYKRIDPGFTTMGAYYFNSDLENYTISPNVQFMDGKVRLNGSIGFQHDNLNHQKAAQNKRLIADANASVELTKRFGFDMIYTNFSDNQAPTTALFADSLRIVQTTQTYCFMPRYVIINADVNHIISASFNHSSLNDYNTFLSAQTIGRNISTNQYFVNYNISFTKRQLSFFLNLNKTQLNGQGMSSDYTGGTVGGNAVFLKQKLFTGLSTTLTKSSGNQSEGAFIINASGNVRYQMLKKQSAGFNIFFTDNKTQAANPLQPNFRETRAELSYQINF